LEWRNSSKRRMVELSEQQSSAAVLKFL
jgi:hypothetical protein